MVEYSPTLASLNHLFKLCKIFCFFTFGLLILFSTSCFCQKKVQIFAGYGYFEGFHAGASFTKTLSKYSFSCFGGLDAITISKQKTWTFGAGFSKAIFLKERFDSSDYKWFASAKVMHLQIEDSYYLFKLIAINPSLSRKIKLSNRIYSIVDAGLAINTVFYSSRKSNLEAGWPYYILPNLGLTFWL